MERKSERIMVKAVIVLLICMWINGEMADAQSCREQRNMLVGACRSLIIRRGPSAYCCHRLRVTNINCVCPVLTRRLAAMIDVNYAVRVIQGCGRPVPRRFRCGSITTP